MAFSVQSTLDKMNSRDKDFRYMATADLVVELGKESFKLDADSEKKLTTKVVQLLEDNSNQVQELVVKCLGPLAKKVKDVQVQEIVDTLCNHLLSEKKGADELRDISSIGLKAVIQEIPLDPPALSSLIVKRLTPRLLTGIAEKEDKPEIVGYCLEALNDLLGKYGTLMVSDHEKILKVVQPQLGSKRTTSRKRAISCLGHLSVTIPDTLFAELINHLIKGIQESSQGDKIRTYIQAVAAISKSVGYRLGKFMSQIIPLVSKYAADKKTDSDDELRENCFQCFESLIHRCPKEITPFLDTIVELCLTYIKYDPNYAEEAEDMETEEDEEQEDDEEVDDQEEDYSDDDDMSWKVRRSAVKCLHVIILTRPEMLTAIYDKIAPALINRFREREENVKLDIFTAFIDLLKQTALFAKRHPDLPAFTKPLNELVPKIVAGITKQLKEKSLKTRGGAFGLLKELVVVARGSLTDHVAGLIPGVQHSLADKTSNSNLKIETLSFLKLLMNTHPAKVFHPHLKVIAVPLFKSARDPYYRISAEALRACSELVHVLRPEGATVDYKPYVPDLFAATLEKLKAQDIDQEVKESAITCMGLTVATFGDELAKELPAVLQILQDRLTNEITRLTAVKALENIASSKLHVDLSPILAEAIKELSSFLRKSNRALKQSALTTLSVVLKNYGSDKKATDLFKSVLTELGPLVNETDLHISHLALHLSTIIVQVHAASAPVVGAEIFPKTLELLKSTLLQGLALDSLMNLLSELVKANAKGFDFETVLDKLLVIGGAKDTSKQVVCNVAKGVAAIATSVKADQRDATVAKFAKELNGKEVGKQHLALYCVGEIGRRADLSSHDSLYKSILATFDSSNEETRQAGSFALGNLAVGNLNKYLPLLLSEINNNPKNKYLLLHSVREVIVRLSTSASGIDSLRGYQKDVIPILFANCENDDEGTRNVVAECLGKLAVISPEELVPAFLAKVHSESANTRATVVTALKFAIIDKPQAVDQLLLPKMSEFLSLLKDKDLNVRRNCLLTLNYAAHNKPILIRDVLPDFLPLIYAESKIKPELIRQVDLGPFKHTVDDGLEIRKAAFETLYTLLDTCLDRVNISAFVTNLADGLKDHYDIKTLAHLMLIRLSVLSGPALLEALDQLVEPLRATVATKAKEGAVKQEVERNDELIRSALRAIVAITRIPNVESNHKFDEFLRQSVKTGELAEKFSAIAKEGEQNDAMDLS